MAFSNTPLAGKVRSIIYKENDIWFGVALEFNIVETGDTPQELMILLDNAVAGYVEAADISHLSIGVLNQAVDPEYEILWKAAMSESPTQTNIYSITTQSLSSLVS